MTESTISGTISQEIEIQKSKDVKTPADALISDGSISTSSLSTPQLIDAESDGELRAAHRKLDYRLLFWYSFVYLIMRIDVTNVTNTAIINIEEGNGIKKELGNITSQQWAWILSIF